MWRECDGGGGGEGKRRVKQEESKRNKIFKREKDESKEGWNYKKNENE